MGRIAVVTGVGGAQGAAIAAGFAAAGWTVRGLTRRAGTAVPGGTAALADPETGEGLAAALEGAAALAVTAPLDFRPGARERMLDALLGAARAAGVARIVLNTAAATSDGSDRPVFATLRRLRDAALAAGAAVVAPTVYLDNLRAPWALPAIVNDGVFAYAAPPEARISWLSHRTLADCVVAAATRPEAAGRVSAVGGPAAVTGPEIAAAVAARTGRPVGYATIPLDGFAAALNGVYGAPAGDDIADLYRRLEAEPGFMARDGSGVAALGVTPESVEAFAARLDWSAAALAAGPQAA